jgi:hypothetical protein
VVQKRAGRLWDAQDPLDARSAAAVTSPGLLGQVGQLGPVDELQGLDLDREQLRRDQGVLT